MEPVGRVPPDRVAVSLTCPPTATDGEAVVTRVGVISPPGVTMTASAGSTQMVPAARLSASPLYWATHW